MFKIESYITPIILSYVDKYVKNVRAEDSQISLWGGDVVFQNLDLKLDVLEEELQLPFNFLSGHIHELSIHVPWTKIASEPIAITINTIEFVLKLRDPSDQNVTKKDGKKKVIRPEEQPPPGYMSTLINKIANNITIKCLNVILKYVEEDIVVSMNIQQLSVESADARWIPAFIDVSLTKVVLRKLINIVDLTICLDKRNAAGKIEVCLEPILYRSSLQARMLRRYNISSLDKSSITRLDVHTKFLDINISSQQQIPMVLRLMDLALALKRGKIKSHMDSTNPESTNDEENPDNEESIVSFLWNMLPSIFPEEHEGEHNDEHEFHVLNTGFYADHVRYVFKTQEIIGDSIVSTTKKIKYSPIIEVDLRNVYGETTICGLRWFNFSGGVSQINVKALDDCTCGQKQTARDLFTSLVENEDPNSHIRNSYFDESSHGSRKYEINWNNHLERYNDEFMLERTPAFAVDIVQDIEIPEDFKMSEIGYDMEFSNLSEKYAMRFFVGPFRAKICADTLHRTKTLVSYKNDYEYAPYYEEKPPMTRSQLPPPSAEDYEALMSEIPLKTMELFVVRPIIEFHLFDHQKALPLTRKKSQSKIINNDRKNPILICEIDKYECSTVTPLYPNRLVYTTCQLPNPPAKLYENCFYSISGNFSNLRMKVASSDENLEILDIIQSTSISHHHKHILLPELWTNAELNHEEHNSIIKKMNLKMNAAQINMFLATMTSLSSRKYEKFDNVDDIFGPNYSNIEVEFNKCMAKYVKIDKTLAYKLTLKSMSALCKQIPILKWPNYEDNDECVTIIAQIPENIDEIEHVPVGFLRVLDLSFTLDPFLIEFLNHQRLKENETKDGRVQFEQHSTSPRKSMEKLIKRPSLPITSVHSSSDKECITFSRTDSEIKTDFINWSYWKRISRKIVFQLEIRHFTLYFPKTSMAIPSFNSIDQLISNEVLIFNLPHTRISSTMKLPNLSHSINKFPIIPPKSVWTNDKENFPWTITMGNISGATIQNDVLGKFLEDTTTNITVALTFADENEENPTTACFHIDTSPFKLNILKNQLILINETVEKILKLPVFGSSNESVKKEHQFIEICQKSSSSNTAADLKEFLDMTQNSTTTDDTLLACIKKENGISIWLQWTFSKVVIECFSDVASKFIVEFEDIIYSLDKQDVYLKLKMKVGSMNGEYFNLINENWDKNEALNFSNQPDVTEMEDKANDIFFDLTLTKAETVNVHTKWGANKKNKSHETLTEVIIKMQQIDTRIDLELVKDFLPLLEVYKKDNQQNEKKQSIWAVSDLPLLHFESKGFRIFIPVEASVFILKIGKINVSHNIENPICRAPLRPDVYTKAAQMRILNIPGSKIEDRQYELTLNDISLSTANWKEVLDYIHEQSSSPAHDNPAFEWNNLQDIQKMTYFDIHTIFKDFNFSIIYAPCIIFKNVLICSQAMELNCLSDLLLDLHTNQIIVAQKIFKNFGNFMGVTEETVKPPEKPSLVEINSMLFRSTSSINHMKKIEDDSGVESLKYSSRRIKSDEMANQIVPYEICFVGGLFKMKISHNSKMLMKIDLVQPNALVQLNLIEKVMQISLFDMKIALEDPFLNTLPGEPDSLGIPQPILKAKFIDSSVKHNEVTVEFRKPIQISLCHEKIQTLLSLKNVFDEILVDSKSSSGQILKPVMSKNKFQIVKSNFHDIQQFHINFSQTVLHLKHKYYDFKASYSNFQSTLKIQERPEKISLTVQIDEFIFSQKSFVILHPFSFNVSATLSQEYWKKDPIVQAKLKSDYLQIDLQPENLIKITEMMKYFNENQENECEFAENKNISIENINLIQLPTPKCDPKSRPVQEEYYQDDLRAGAFQFIESCKTSELPLPYQIQIINKEIGIVCWRYPQPRILNKVFVYPVPMNSSKTINITCKLEYFSEIYNEFFELCNFTLSENEKLDLKLPTMKASSSIWRILMTQHIIADNSDNSDNEDEDSSLITNITEVLTSSHRITNLPYRLHPKIFVACMRVDSCFSPKYIPNIEITVDIKPIQINFMNTVNFEDCEMPKILKGYTFCRETNEFKLHKFMTLSLNKLKIHGSSYNNEEIIINCDSAITCDLLDYAYLNFEPVLDVLSVKTNIEYTNNATNLNIISDDIVFRYGPSVGYTLMVAEKIWLHSLKSPLYAKYIICNNTLQHIKFGQYQTMEAVFLAAKEVSLYAFRSNKHPQKLQIFTENNFTSCPFNISKEGIHFVPILNTDDEEDDKIFIIKVENLTNLQKKIVINGQISFYNMTCQSLRVHYRIYKAVKSDEKNYDSNHFILGDGQSANILGTANVNSQQIMRISMGQEKKGWSGDIPLKEIMNGSKPYLVKIPTTQTKEGFISYWVRIIREDIIQNRQRVLVIIWPLFMVRSMLTVNTNAYDEKLDKTFSIYGQGMRGQLLVPGTNIDEHELLFRMNFNSPHNEDTRKAILSYKLIDSKTFFQIPEKFKMIENAIEALEKFQHYSPKAIWPCSREEEIRCKRSNSIQDATMPNYKCSAASDISCSLMLNIAPWCLFINSLGCQVKLKNTTNEDSCLIEPNNIIMPFYIEKSFQIELVLDEDVKSDIIYINSDIKRTTSNSYVIPEDGSTEIHLRSANLIYNLVMSSTNENGLRVIILSSQYVVANLSSYDLKCWSFAILSNERIDCLKPEDSFPLFSSYELATNEKNAENPRGQSMISFNNLSKKTNKLKSNSNFNYFLTFYQKEGKEFSRPVAVSKTVTRKSFCVQYENFYIPLSLSIISHQNQNYVTIYDDAKPSISVENRTDFNIYVAQAESVNVSRTASAVAEGSESNFCWYQMVQSKKMVYYTPPRFDDDFPELIANELGLIFACVTGSAVRWSHPVKIDENKSIFLNIPLYGDLQLLVDTKGQTIQIIIDYISQNLEFSVKDIRTRLLNPRSEDTITTPLSTPTWSKTSCEVDQSKDIKINKRDFIGKTYIKGLNIILFKDTEDHCSVKKELITLNFDQIAVKLFRGSENHLQFSTLNIQIDNQLYADGEFDFPVIFCSQAHEEIENIPALPSIYELDDTMRMITAQGLCTLQADLDPNKILNAIESIYLKFNPIRAYIEDTYINVLLDYLVESLPMNLIYQEEADVPEVKCEAGEVLVPKIVVQQSLYCSEPMRFKFVKINPLNVLLSVHTCMRLYIALDHSPLDFSAFERRNVRTLPIKLGNAVGMHYLSGAIFGGGWVIGSLEILGSPSGLARSVTSGLKDFVSLPVQGLFRGPWGFILGVTQGSASLVRNITAGTVNSVTKLATSVARNLDRLSLDNEHVQRTDALRRSRPQGVTEGFTQGLTGLGISILGAVGGLAHHPMQATSPVGIVTGMGKGIVGAFTKPISGAAELLALTGQGMLQSVGYNTLPVPKALQPVGHKVDPISFKPIWAPQTPVDGHLLLTFQATLLHRTGYRSILIGIYTKTFVILEIGSSQIIEILELDTIHPSIDNAVDQNQVTLIIKPELPPPQLEDIFSYPVSSRTVQYVQDSLINLSVFKTGHHHFYHHQRVRKNSKVIDEEDENETTNDDLQLSSTKEDVELDISVMPTENTDDHPSEKVEDFPKNEDDNERRLVFFMNDNLAKYLVNYVNLLKRNQHSNTSMVFLPFEF